MKPSLLIIWLWRETRDAWTSTGPLALTLFAGLVGLAPLVFDLAPSALIAQGPGLIWLALTLTNILILDRLFAADVETGQLDMLALAPVPLSVFAFMRLSGHVLGVALPLAVVASLCALGFAAPLAAVPTIALCTLLGGSAMLCLAAPAVALAAGVRRAALLVSLLGLPFLVPVLIFGSTAMQAAFRNEIAPLSFAMLGGLTALGLGLAPLGVAAAFRLHLGTGR